MTQTATETTQKTPSTPPSRRTLRKAHRDKLQAKLRTDREFAKTFFEARSKRAADKKSAFRKKKSKKK